MPALSTDGQPLRPGTLNGTLCRQEGSAAPCLPVDTAQTGRSLTLVAGSGPSTPVLWTDLLPPPLAGGTPRPIAYRVSLRSAGGSAGYSDPVYTAAGAAPPPVAELRAEGTRLGITLRWIPVPGAGEVLLRRSEPASPAKAATAATAALPGTSTSSTPTTLSTPSTSSSRSSRKARAQGGAKQGPAQGTQAGERTGPDLVWLQAAPGDAGAAATVDNTIEPGIAYRYTALRRVQVRVGGRTLELESRHSAPVTVTWQDVYPPPVPTELTALGYTVPAADGQPTGYAVDLVWLPVEDRQLAGYLVYRQALGEPLGEPLGQASGDSQRGLPAQPGTRLRLTPQPVPTPGFHDAAAQPGQRYLYSVSAIAANGRESTVAETVVEPQTGR